MDVTPNALGNCFRDDFVAHSPVRAQLSDLAPVSPWILGLIDVDSFSSESQEKEGNFCSPLGTLKGNCLKESLCEKTLALVATTKNDCVGISRQWKHNVLHECDKPAFGQQDVKQLMTQREVLYHIHSTITP